ncbi:iron-containing alcohol dehydrogenase [Planktomarina sp.]|nr:iron-containing alcohol dehydrogenase [Planktomarina sp.]MDA9100653.1 iron-containing alcohol dehydrogenase [Planktomarina sp.]
MTENIDVSNGDLDGILNPQDWSFPVPIKYGPGRLVEAGGHLIMMGVHNPLIVTDRGSHKLPFIGQLQNHLTNAGLTVGLYSDISPNPKDTEIGAGRAQFISGGHDAIIAIGGGSAMDGGKSICLTANNDIDLWAFEYEQKAPEINANQSFPKLITIPTTAGTGAETESTAMVTHVEKGMKFCVWHPELKPSLVLLDPELTIGLPANLTAWTGADAMTHAIEAYLVPGFNPLCDGLALEGLALVSKWLRISVNEPHNMKARGAMLVGSCLGGIAFLKGLGLVHAISHMVGAEFDTQHGLTNAVVLPVVLRFNLPGQELKVQRMAQVMGLEDTSTESFIRHIEGVLDDINIPNSLSDLDIPMASAQRLAEKSILDSAAQTNPRTATVPEISTLIEEAILKAR